MPETAFTICGFWYMHALAAVGRREEARELFERMLAGRTRLGLLSEDIDPRPASCGAIFRRPTAWWASINSAVRLSRSWEEASMSRLVAVSNRDRDAAQGQPRQAGSRSACSRRCRLAAGCGSAGAATWSTAHRAEPAVSSRGGITFATTDLAREDHELHYYIGFCNSALWPLFHYFARQVPVRRRAVRGVSARQPPVRGTAAAAAAAGRRRLGARLSPDPARRRACATAACAAAGVLPAHSVSAHRGAAHPAGIRRADARAARLRLDRLPDRTRSRVVPFLRARALGTGRDRRPTASSPPSAAADACARQPDRRRRRRRAARRGGVAGAADACSG